MGVKGMKPSMRLYAWLAPLLAGAVVLGWLGSEGTAQAPHPQAWQSRAIPEARGDIQEVDGKRVQVRYKAAPFTGVTGNFEKWPTYAHADTKTYPPPSQVPMPAIEGDPKEGRKLFMDRAKAPCTGCHLIQGDDVWPAGSIGPDLSTFGDRSLPDQFVFNLIYDARVFFPNTSMPPWGTAGSYKPEEIVHIVAFLKTQKGNPPFVPPLEKDPARNPFTRKLEYYFGDNLDPTTNPAIVLAESAMALWTQPGPAGKACGDCHAGGPERAMKGVATRYPKYMAKHGRIMSIEDLLTVHAPETTGMEMLAQSADNLHMTMLIKMQSNGMPVDVDVTSPEAKAAYERGQALYFKKVGERNHACADCHQNTPGKGAGKFLGGRLLGDAEKGFTKHFPVWRTSPQAVWDIRRRLQWCMLPLGMNMLPADAPEYADLELYLTAFDQGKPMNVPGIRH
jgi:L-cysteine S-thiosulfotransferase